jgi:ABC-type cobalamin/Fe3+-siderophores transport system ATPase subunit
MSNVLLKVSGLKVAYGGIQAVKGVDFEVREGELVTLIGSNGAGKTTTMKAITGTLPPLAGEIEYLGKSIKGQGAWDLVKQGLAMVVLGGLGHLPGVILGAVLLSALPEVLRYVAGPLQEMTDGRLDAPILRQMLIALAMIIVMLMRPKGLWPSPEHGKSLLGKAGNNKANGA